MASQKIIDVVLRMKDQMTGPMNKSMSKLQEHARQYQRIGSSMIRTGRKISKAGAALTKTITAPVVALSAVAYKEYGEYDKSMRLVQQTMGATDEEAQMLADSLRKAAENSVFGMQDGADAALNFARAGYTAKQSADMIAPSFSLAAGTATDLSTVTAGLSSTLKAFKEDSSQASVYSDIFAKAQAQANTTVTDLFDSMSKASSVFETAGWNVKDLAVATGVLGDAYISGSEAGNALKSGIANLSSPSKNAAAWIERMGINVTKADGTYKSFAETQEILHNAFGKLNDSEQISAATAIFGKFQMAKWLAIIKRSPDDIKQMTNALDGATGSADGMADALMSGAGGAIEKLKSNWDIFKKTFGETLAPIITPLLEKVTELMQAFNNLSDEQKKNIVKWVAIAAAAGPALSIFGKLVIGGGKLFKMFGKIGLAVKNSTGIFKLFAGAPKGAMLGALGAIGVAVGLIIKNWDSITKKISGFYNKIKPAIEKIAPFFKKVFGVIEKVLSGTLMNTLETFLGAIDGITTALGGVVDFLTGVFSGNWEKAWEGIKSIFSGIWDGILSVAKGVLNGIINAVNLVIDGINTVLGAFNKTSGFIKNTFENSPTLQKAAEEKGIDWRSAGGGIPHIPTLGVGTNNWKGGIAQISERGGEIVDLPKGSRVYPHDESVRKAYEDGAGHRVSITIPKLADTITVREEADIDKIATKLASKLERVSQNMGSSQIRYQYQS